MGVYDSNVNYPRNLGIFGWKHCFSRPRRARIKPTCWLKNRHYLESGLKPEVLRFDAARGELRLQVTAPGFTEIERFRELAGKRFAVQQGEVRSTEGKVEGALVLKGRSS